MKTLFNITVIGIFVWLLASLFPVFGPILKGTWLFIKFLPQISKEQPEGIYLLLVSLVFFSLTGFQHRSALTQKKVFLIWDKNEGILGPSTFQDIRNLSPETLILKSTDPIMEPWRPLRSWYPNGYPRTSRRLRMLLVASLLALAGAHTLNLLPSDCLNPWIIFGPSIILLVASFLVPSSGSIQQKPSSFWGTLLGGPNPPDFKS